MRSRYVGVGIFVVVGSLLFATAVFLIGNQHISLPISKCIILATVIWRSRH